MVSAMRATTTKPTDKIYVVNLHESAEDKPLKCVLKHKDGAHDGILRNHTFNEG